MPLTSACSLETRILALPGVLATTSIKHKLRLFFRRLILSDAYENSFPAVVDVFLQSVENPLLVVHCLLYGGSLCQISPQK